MTFSVTILAQSFCEIKLYLPLNVITMIGDFVVCVDYMT